MPPLYKYELWNGKEVVGHYVVDYLLRGKSVTFTCSPGIFKEVYGKKYEQIVVPFIWRTVSDNGIDILSRLCLDVRRKSKRQLRILKEGCK